MIRLHQNVRYRLAAALPSCPIRSKMYGGIPSGGGFGPWTEWELGAQRMGEAAHCILGSLGKWGDAQWDLMTRYEKEHVEEELGIIQRVMREYVRPLYTDRLNSQDYYPDADIQATVQSVQSVGPELAARATDMLQWWGEQRDVPQPIHDLGTLTYGFLVRLANAMLTASAGWPDEPLQNPYQDPELVEAAEVLAHGVDNVYGAPYEPVEREPSPRAPTPQQQQRDQRDLDWLLQQAKRAGANRTVSLQRDGDWWYIGDVESAALTGNHPGDTFQFEPLSEDLAETTAQDVVKAFGAVQQAAQQLGMEAEHICVFLVEFALVDAVGMYIYDSAPAGAPVFCFDPAQHSSFDEIAETLLHELAHAYMDVLGIDPTEDQLDQEDIAEDFGRTYLPMGKRAVELMQRAADEGIRGDYIGGL